MKKQFLTLIIGTAALTASPAFGMEEDMQDKEDTYVLSVGQKASERLDLQDRLFSADTYDHLQKAGLSEGQTVWDIGCGSGAMTLYLARAVGKKGRVYAIDISEAQLAIAKNKVTAAGLENVKFIHGDIRSLQNLPMGKAKLVCMRFLLMHVKDPETVIGIVKKLLKDGGVAVSQESIMSTSHSSSGNEVFKEYVETLVDLGQKLGVDYDIGNRLHLLYEQAGYVNTDVYYSQPTVNLADTKKIIPSTLSEWKDKAIAAELTTKDKVENWDCTIRSWPDDDMDFFFALPKQAHVLAWKEKL